MTRKTITIFDIPVDNIAIEDAVGFIRREVRQPGLTQVAFVNADCLNISVTHSEYRALLQRVPAVFADGSGLRYASKLLGTPIIDNVNGTDLFPLLCELALQENLSFYFLGARPRALERMVDRVQRRYPGINIAGTQHGYFSPQEEETIIHNIAASGADILFVAFGAPRQDLWIHTHASKLTIPVALGVGGLFDFAARRISRAPLWVRRMGLEWIVRLMWEPWRMAKRYLIGNPLFLWRIVLWRNRRRHP